MKKYTNPASMFGPGDSATWAGYQDPTDDLDSVEVDEDFFDAFMAAYYKENPDEFDSVMDSSQEDLLSIAASLAYQATQLRDIDYLVPDELRPLVETARKLIPADGLLRNAIEDRVEAAYRKQMEEV